MIKGLIKNVFPHFDEELVDVLEKVSVVRNYTKGQALASRGKTLNGLTIITSGNVKVYQEGEDGNEFVIGYVKIGSSFGGSICDDDRTEKKSMLNFKAIENTGTLLISFADKDILAKKYNNWYKYLLQNTVNFQKFYLDKFENIAFKNLDGRVLFFLEQFSKIYENSTLRISHREIAESLNSSREVVSRILKKMEQEGKINMSHNEIEILSF